jgi:hypothetical protein
MSQTRIIRCQSDKRTTVDSAVTGEANGMDKLTAAGAIGG